MFVPPEFGLYSTATADRERWTRHFAGDVDARILAADEAVTTRQANCRPALLAVKQAKGIRVEDYAGRQYIDLHGNNCHHIGYGHPRLVAALTDQLSRLACNTRGFTNREFTEFAALLSRLWPGNDGRVFLVPGGAAANELALAIARVHTNRHKSITFDDSYHGRSFGAVSLTGDAAHRSPRLGPLLPGALHVPSFRPRPNGPKDPEAAARVSFDSIRAILENDREVACLLAEPMAIDARRPPDWYWPGLRELCDRHGVILIFDEVPTGLGKLGALFNSENFGVRPDFTVLGKALGGAALPAAAVVVDGRYDSAPELNLGYFTHEKNPLMALAAHETLKIIEDEDLVARGRALGAFALAVLQEIGEQHARIVQGPVRGAGPVLSLDIGETGGDVATNEALANTVFFLCIERGVILNYPSMGARLTFSFPLVSTKEDVLEVCDVFDQVLSAFPVPG